MKRTIFIAALLLGFFSQNTYGRVLTAPQTTGADSADTSTAAGVVTVNTPTERIHVYPNPSKGTFYFNGIKGNTLEVFDLYGQNVYNAEADRDKYPVNLSARGKGIYSYRIIDQGALVQQGKIIVVE